MMNIEKLIERLKAKDFERDYDCTPFECGVFGLLDTAATALSTLQAENEKLRAELEQVKRALAMMWYAYDNKDGEFPHEYEIEAMQEAENVLGPWAECMPKYLQRGQEKNEKGFLICPASGMEITETDYCSYGERMDKEDEHD
jgi:hypothetical protein